MVVELQGIRSSARTNQLVIHALDVTIYFPSTRNGLILWSSSGVDIEPVPEPLPVAPLLQDHQSKPLRALGYRRPRAR